MNARSSPGDFGPGAPRILFSFVAGLLAVLVGREPALWLLALAAPRLVPLLPESTGAALTATLPPAYATDPVTPLALPRLLVIALAGGLLAVVLARLVRRDGSRPVRLLKGLLFGAIVPTAFVVLVWGGLPWHHAEGSINWGAMLLGLAVVPQAIANAAWGVATIAIADPLIGSRRPVRSGRLGRPPPAATAPRR